MKTYPLIGKAWENYLLSGFTIWRELSSAGKKTDIHKLFKKLNLEVRSTKHKYGWLVVDGKKILRVHYSHGKGDVVGKISDKVRNQLRLTQDDFLNLINCPLSAEQYTEILRDKGLI